MKLYELTAHELHDKLVNKELSSVELTNALYERIDEVEDKVNAYITLDKENALAQAAKVDAKIAAGEKLAGEVAYSTDGLKATATEAAVTVEFSSAKSCASGLKIPFRVAPVTLEDGFIITLTDSNGKEHTFTHDRKVDMKVGERTVFETTL